MRRIVLIFVLALPGVAVAWAGLNLPPPLFLLKYGPSPGAAPTGRVIEVEGLEFVEIGPGISRMGSDYLLTLPGVTFTAGDLLGRVASSRDLPFGTAGFPSDEMPIHWVEFPRPFAIASCEITWARIAMREPDDERDRHPAAGVTWEQARAWCARAAERTGLPIRLPSEAEWECACRAGSFDLFCFGDDPARLGEYAVFDPDATGVWTSGDPAPETEPVGSRKPNAWGLYDMHGNVSEWVEDAWHGGYLGAPTDGSVRAGGDPRFRVFRGGDRRQSPDGCRSGYRRRWTRPTRWGWTLGFRPALTPPR